MDKQVEANQADSISAVQVKVNDYEPSEYAISEPPPAYRKRASSVEIARIISFTLIACSFILGCFIFAASYVESQANMCSIQQESLVQNLGGNADLRDNPSYQALQDPLVSEESKQPQQQQQTPIQIKMPVQIDFDDLAAALIEKNQKTRMNCVIEKRKSEEMMDHQSKNIALPFGVNVTTDPKYEHVTGERMSIFCESGNDDNKPEQAMRPPPMLPMVPNQPQLHPLMFDHPPERKPLLPIEPQRIFWENLERRQPPFMQQSPFFVEERRFPQPNQFAPEERRFPQPNQFVPEERRFPQPNQFVPEERRFPQPNQFVPEERRFHQPNPFVPEERRFPHPNQIISEERRFRQPNQFVPEEKRFPQPNQFVPEERRFPQPNQFVPEERRFPQPNQFVPEERRFPQPNQFAPEERRFPQQFNGEERRFGQEERRFPQPNQIIFEERRFPQPFNGEERRPQQNTFVIEERKVPQPQQQTANSFLVEERRQFPHANQFMIEERKQQFEGPQIMFEERRNGNQQPQQVHQSIFIEERKPNQEMAQGIIIEETKSQSEEDRKPIRWSQPIQIENDRKMPIAEAHTMVLTDNGERKQGPITIIAREEHVIPVYQREADAPPPPSTQSRRIHLEPVPLESQHEKLFKPHQPEANLIESRAFSNTIENLNMIIAEVAASNPQQEPSDVVRPPPPPFQRLPIHIPINMMQQEQEPEQEQEQRMPRQEQNLEQQNQQQEQLQDQSSEQVEQEQSESLRPHYVQPRSIREKRSPEHKILKRE